MTKYLIFSIPFFSLFYSCSDRILRGYEETSPDQETYLAIEEDKGGGAIPDVYIDNELWPHQNGEKGIIESGIHTIGHTAESCSIQFTIKSQTVFHFDYWGP